MLQRKIMNNIAHWLNSNHPHPLVIEGARQVGKTFVIQQFIKTTTDRPSVEINLIQRPDLCAIFEGDITPDGLLAKLKPLFPMLFSSPKQGILFIDEIQQCPNAIVALKSFSLLNQVRVIASGSLLGVSYQKVRSFPVGYVERFSMYPLDFEEFIQAVDQVSLYESIVERFQQESIPEIHHQSMMKLFRDYVIVGGMPEVVMTYLDTKDLYQVFQVQQRIINDYQSDIAKYAATSERVKAREIFDSIPAQLAKDNKKFQYKYIREGARSALYDGSIQWLIDAGIVYRCHNVSRLELPLASYRIPNEFKIYMMDTGLLVSMLGQQAQQQIVLNDLGIAKGGLYENIIAVLLSQLDRPLYYYNRKSTLEIDFIEEWNQKVVPIEVKAGGNTRSRSLKTLLSEGMIEQGVRVSSNPYHTSKSIEQLPFYLFYHLTKTMTRKKK